MIGRKECIEYCRKEADKFKGCISDHEGDRKYSDLVPSWRKYAEIYGSIISYLTEGNI